MQTEKVAVTYRDALLGDQLQTPAHPEKELLGDRISCHIGFLVHKERIKQLPPVFFKQFYQSAHFTLQLHLNTPKKIMTKCIFPPRL